MPTLVKAWPSWRGQTLSNCPAAYVFNANQLVIGTPASWAYASNIGITIEPDDVAEAINIGTLSNTAGAGMDLNAATAAVRIYGDDAGAALWASGSVPDIRVTLSRMLIGEDNTGGNIRTWGLMGQLKSYDGFWNNEQVGAVHGRLEIVRSAATLTLGGYGVSAGGAFTVATSGTITVNTNHILAGVAAISDFRATLTQTGKTAAFYAGAYDTTNWSDSTARTTWGYGLVVANSAATTGIWVGTCTSGLVFSGTQTTEITLTNLARIFSATSTGGVCIYDDIAQENDRILYIDGDATNATKGARQGAIGIALDRQTTAAMSGWDGNPDCGLKIQVNQRADNTVARGAVRALDIQARNRLTCVWVKTMELNGRNDSGANCVNLEGLHIRMENYGQVDDDITGLHVEMSSENDTSSPTKTAVLIRNTDQSGMTAVRDVIRVAHTSTNGFTNLFYFNATSGDTVASGSLKDSANADIKCDYYIVNSINGTPYYIPLYDTLN